MAKKPEASRSRRKLEEKDDQRVWDTRQLGPVRKHIWVLASRVSQFSHRPVSFCVKTQYPGKSSNFPVMFIGYYDLLWKEIRENSFEDIYSDF